MYFHFVQTVSENGYCQCLFEFGKCHITEQPIDDYFDYSIFFSALFLWTPLLLDLFCCFIVFWPISHATWALLSSRNRTKIKNWNWLWRKKKPNFGQKKGTQVPKHPLFKVSTWKFEMERKLCTNELWTTNNELWTTLRNENTKRNVRISWRKKKLFHYIPPKSTY